MRKIITLAFCCTLATLQFSCTSVLYVDKTQPAEVAVANEQWKVAVINRFNSSLLDIKKEKKLAVLEDGARHAFAGAIEGILQDETYDIVYTDTASYRATTYKEGLEREEVQAIDRQHPHHLLLSLEHFDAFLEQETVREQDNSKMAYFTLVTASTWALYDSTGNLLDMMVLTEKDLYNTRPVISGLLAVGPSLGNAGAMINDLAWYTGAGYWSRLSPKPVRFSRSYYSTKNLLPAAHKMAANDWSNAIALLEPLADGSHKKDAARAAYNLAVVYEAMGDIEQAKFWAREAIKRKEKLAALLLPELERY
ncbi:DUF6340 domain-containing protein [Pontibacter korlensis]|uniref:Tetratricopeptide repeat protein n=1 Tax=Pontibacter korlensis TaxID=400092 RepID=A0A0E3ZI83_9BACT|nr:DUF6340 family protein [Pontibacter korlensis]AKD04498.1 hypothetical protein PKOR_17125 [Pontibacter korlensis]